MTYSIQNEIDTIKNNTTHLCILGAGASLAAFPDGDKNGKKLPLMSNLIEIIGLKEILENQGFSCSDINNFELFYDKLHRSDQYSDLLKEIEKKIYSYFSSLSLPDNPCIYDLLVIGLKNKDVIATFNWDPFLFQALSRNYCMQRKRYGQAMIPQALYLHGNVAQGYCAEGNCYGPIGKTCSKSGKLFKQIPLLYPISKKNYESPVAIKKSWLTVQASLKKANMVTIFGYGAPESDINAIDLFTKGWGNAESREFEEIELINIESEDILVKKWGKFIFNDHYRVEKDFFNSQIAQHPRRSIEALFANIYDCKFTENNPFPKDFTFEDLYKFLDPLINIELKK